MGLDLKGMEVNGFRHGTVEFELGFGSDNVEIAAIDVVFAHSTLTAVR